jgi:uncharacterized protein YdbL (DUF1318 family)
MRNLTLPVIACAGTLALGACVTVNVYFPAAEVRDLSRKIEEEVRKQAAQDAETAPETPVADAPPAEGTTSWLDTLAGVTPAYAQEVPAPEVTSPAIRKIIESRASRVSSLGKHKAAGVIGENNRGLVEIRNLEALSDLKERAEAQRLVKAENADRDELFREIAAIKKVDLSQLDKIRETYAGTIREMARPGEWIQSPDGSWKQK